MAKPQEIRKWLKFQQPIIDIIDAIYELEVSRLLTPQEEHDLNEARMNLETLVSGIMLEKYGEDLWGRKEIVIVTTKYKNGYVVKPVD